MNVGTRTAMNRRGFVGLLGLAGVGTVGTAFAPEHIGHAAEIEAAQTVAESAVSMCMPATSRCPPKQPRPTPPPTPRKT